MVRMFPNGAKLNQLYITPLSIMYLNKVCDFIQMFFQCSQFIKAMFPSQCEQKMNKPNIYMSWITG